MHSRYFIWMHHILIYQPVRSCCFWSHVNIVAVPFLQLFKKSAAHILHSFVLLHRYS